MLSFLPACSSDETAPETASEQTEPAPASTDPEPVAPRDPEPLPASNDRSVAQRIEDASLAAQVKKALLRSDTLRHYDLEVDAYGGRVAVRGSVATAQDFSIAAEVARSVEGVQTVSNQIAAPDVTPDPALAMTDTSDLPDTTAADPAPSTALADAEPADPPEETAPEPEEEESAQEETHTVQSGESLWRIAQRYDVSVDELRRLNDLSQRATLQPGQELRVR